MSTPAWLATVIRGFHPNTLPVWLVNATHDLGLKETPGAAATPRIVEIFKLAGFSGVKSDETAWCAAFVGAHLRVSGLKSSGSLWALDYAKFGSRLPGPLVGAIATKERKNSAGRVIGGHVFFVVGWDDEWIWGLGGNQNNACTVAKFRRRDIKAFVWPPGAERPVDFPKVMACVIDAKAEAAVTET